MAPRTRIAGEGYEIASGRALIDGTGYYIANGRTLIAGTGYDIPIEKPIAELPVGSSVFLNVGGSLQEFLIVNQGNPDATKYDGSCDGAWLVMKDLHEKRAWDSADSDYANSDVHTYLNSTFLASLDVNVAAQIKQVKLPYLRGAGLTGQVYSGANGLTTKVFLLSGYEVGFTNEDSFYFPTDGARLSYFESGDTAGGTNREKRITRLGGAATSWWLRSAATVDTKFVWSVSSYGSRDYVDCTTSHGIRPALILPSDSKVDGDFRVV